jgi:hypothetical protein
MVASDELFRLIQSLDKKERAYFKWQSEHDADYLKLFDAIAAQSSYDENKVKLKFKGELFIRRLPAVKNYLFHLILRSLSAQYAGNTEESFLKIKLEEIHFLLQRGLRKAALKIVVKARALAEAHNLYLFVLQIIAYERILAYGNVSEYFDTVISKLRADEEKNWKLYANLTAYVDLNTRLQQLRQTILQPRLKQEFDQFKAILNDPLLGHISNALSLDAKIYFYQVQSACYQMLQKPKPGVKHGVQVVRLYESKTALTELEVLRFSGALHELSIGYRMLHLREDSMKCIDRMRALPQQYPSLLSEKNSAIIFKRSTTRLTDDLQFFGLFNEGLQHVSEIELGLKRFRYYIDKYISEVIRYNTALLLFGAGQFRSAIRWLNIIINENKQGQADSIGVFAMILRLIIHIELKNEEVLTNLVREIQKQEQKEYTMGKVEKSFLDFVLNYAQLINEKDKRHLYIETHTHFKRLFKDPLGKYAEEYFDFISWFQSKIQKQPFSVSYNENLKMKLKRKQSHINP